MSDTLVAYFSATGVTRKKAKALAKVRKADLYEITPKKMYTNKDLDWNNGKSRTSMEMKDEDIRPELANIPLPEDNYRTVYVGFPIWWYTAPRIINSFLEKEDFGDAEIHLFATSGGSTIQRAVKDLQRLYPKLRIKDGKMLNGAVK